MKFALICILNVTINLKTKKKHSFIVLRIADYFQISESENQSIRCFKLENYITLCLRFSGKQLLFLNYYNLFLRAPINTEPIYQISSIKIL